MSSALETFIEHAKSLSQEEKVVAFDVLQEMISPPDQAWHDAWNAEAEARIQALDRGEMEMRDFDEVIEMIKQELTS